jgi:hypothetical protein
MGEGARRRLAVAHEQVEHAAARRVGDRRPQVVVGRALIRSWRRTARRGGRSGAPSRRCGLRRRRPMASSDQSRPSRPVSTTRSRVRSSPSGREGELDQDRVRRVAASPSGGSSGSEPAERVDAVDDDRDRGRFDGRLVVEDELALAGGAGRASTRSANQRRSGAGSVIVCHTTSVGASMRISRAMVRSFIGPVTPSCLISSCRPGRRLVRLQPCLRLSRKYAHAVLQWCMNSTTSRSRSG